MFLFLFVFVFFWGVFFWPSKGGAAKLLTRWHFTKLIGCVSKCLLSSRRGASLTFSCPLYLTIGQPAFKPLLDLFRDKCTRQISDSSAARCELCVLFAAGYLCDAVCLSEFLHSAASVAWYKQGRGEQWHWTKTGSLQLFQPKQRAKRCFMFIDGREHFKHGVLVTEFYTYRLMIQTDWVLYAPAASDCLQGLCPICHDYSSTLLSHSHLQIWICVSVSVSSSRTCHVTQFASGFKVIDWLFEIAFFY